jgi:NAD(P) transhydrogenase subunit alpha
MSGWNALYIFMLAAFTGYVVISAVPVILHTPLMSGSNFVHGIVLVGAMIALGFAQTGLEQAIGVFAVALGAMNVVGGYVVTVRMLSMFKSSRERERPSKADGGGQAGGGAASASADRGPAGGGASSGDGNRKA